LMYAGCHKLEESENMTITYLARHLPTMERGVT